MNYLLYTLFFTYTILFAPITINNEGKNSILNSQGAQPKLISKNITTKQPRMYEATYVNSNGREMRSRNFYSTDYGRSWNYLEWKANFNLKVPYGYRRGWVSSAVDDRTNRLVTIHNSMDVLGLNTRKNEPQETQTSMYLRYRVSIDNGISWITDEPITSNTLINPFPGVSIGQNSLYLGDAGSIPVFTSNGTILLGAQTTIKENGRLFNPGGGHTYTDVLVLRGKWVRGNRISWVSSTRVNIDPNKSTRGLLEPTIIELKPGKLLMVMRGSNGGKNDIKNKIPSYKWYSISRDDGIHWTQPQPWSFSNEKPFFSPSSMSVLFRHSSGRVFWVGNISPENSKGGLPRNRVVFAEVNRETNKLIRSNTLVLDNANDRAGRVDFSHFRIIEDRFSKDIVLTYPRNFVSKNKIDWVTAKIRI